MDIGGCADAHQVHVHLAQHVLVGGEDLGVGEAVFRFLGLSFFGVDIAQRHDFAPLGEGQIPLDVHGGDVAGSDDCYL